MNRSACLTTALLSVALGCADDLTTHSTYEDHAAVVSSDAIQRGLVPSWIPVEARSIRVVADLEGNRVWTMFEVGAGAADRTSRGLDSIAGPDDEIAKISYVSGPDWWPECLSDPATASCEIGDARFVGDEFVAAADVANGRIYAWTSPRIVRFVGGGSAQSSESTR